MCYARPVSVSSELSRSLIKSKIHRVHVSTDLTRIGDAYRWFHGKVSDRPTNFSWIISGKLAGCGLPVTHLEFQWLLDQGVKSIVTVREVPLPEEWLGDGISYKHLQVEDYGAPSLEDLDDAVNFMKAQIAAERPVTVHCAAGKGRTGVVLAAYMVNTQGISAKQAIADLRSMRPGSVQSETQEMAISMYEKFVNSKQV